MPRLNDSSLARIGKNMKENFINEDLFGFIKEFKDSDPGKLALSESGKTHNFDLNFALLQIEAKKKYRNKFPSFTSEKYTLFPSRLAAEQATAEVVSKYRSGILPYSESLLDMTAGLGIDSIWLSKNFKKITVCELDTLKAKILEHNTSVLNIKNIEILNCDSVEYLKNYNKSFSLIYIDPARRGENDKRLYSLKDCQPNVLEHLPLMSQKTKRIIVKCSPMLDVTQTLKELPSLSSLTVVCLKGECKEIMIEIDFMNHIKQNFIALDLDDEGNLISSFSFTEEKKFGAFPPDKFNGLNNTFLKEVNNPNHCFPESKFSNIETLFSSNILSNPKTVYAEFSDLKPGIFIYEPNAAVMKLSPWTQISNRFPQLKKFDKNTHLFLSENLYPDFPGRKLKVEKIITKKDKKFLADAPLNIVTRNFPVSADKLRKEWKLKEGKDKFLYASKLDSKPVLLLAERIK